MARRTIGTIIIIQILILLSCERTLFNSPLETAELIFGDIYFNELCVNGFFDIILKQDSIFKVVVETHIDMADGIQCIENGGVLELNDTNFKRMITSYPSPTATIHFPKIDLINVYSPANITTQGTIVQENLSMVLLGHAGNVNLNLKVGLFRLVTGANKSMGIYHLSGEVENASLWIRGACSLNSEDLTINDAKVINNSIGDCRVNVANSLRVVLNSFGNIYYTNTPKEIIIEEQSSTGQLIKVE